MRKIALTIAAVLALFCGADIFAQGKYGADSAECIKYLSYYKEYFKQKNYDESYPQWKKAYELCPPTASQNMILDGTTLIRREISKTKDAAAKEQLISTLLNMHDIRAQYYPKYAATALNNKGLDIANYVKDDAKFLLDNYKSIVSSNGEKVKPQLLLFELNAAIDLYQQNQLEADEVINIYQENMSIINKILSKSGEDDEQNSKVKTDLESLFISSKVASCDNLIALFTPRFDANPDDNDLVTNIVRMLSNTEGCQDNDLYLKAVTSLYKNDPSYTSAYFLYKLNMSRGNINDAIRYMEEAIAYPESDDATDGEYYYELATFCYKNGQAPKAYESARKAASLNSEFEGKAYFLIGTIWGATKCHGDEISSRAPYWVAVDYLQKAKAADETLAEEANKLIASFSRYYPQTAEAFMYDITDGQSYNVSCGGMSATTTVRTQK